MNYNRGQNKMEPQIAIKDEAAQTPKRTIFPSLIWGKGGDMKLKLKLKLKTTLIQKREKASLVSRVSRFTEEKGKRGMSSFSFNPLFNNVPCSPLSLLIRIIRCVFVLHLTGFNFTRSTVLTVGTMAMGRIEKEMEEMSHKHTISK